MKARLAGKDHIITFNLIFPCTITILTFSTMPSLRLGNIAPDFEAQTTAGPIKFHDWIGNSWVSYIPTTVDGRPDRHTGHSFLSSWRFYPCLHH